MVELGTSEARLGGKDFTTGDNFTESGPLYIPSPNPKFLASLEAKGPSSWSGSYQNPTL